MMRWIILLSMAFLAAAFIPGKVSTNFAQRQNKMQLQMKSNNIVKNVLASAFLGFSFLSTTGMARAEIDYEGVKYLGGGSKVDLNNANIRAYLDFPGMYPTVASKVVTHGPYKTVGDIYNIPGLTNAEKDVLKKYESKFVVLDPKPEYVLDKINNGLYR